MASSAQIVGVDQQPVLPLPETRSAHFAASSAEDSSPTSPTGVSQHPPSFYCPISCNVMHDPVVLCDGHTYERQYIERWLQVKNTSPVSGLELQQQDIFPNHALRNAIEEYFQQVFSVHRRAIRKTIKEPAAHQSLGSNAPFLRTIDALMQCSLLMNADLSTECVLRRIMDEAKTLVGAEVASVFLVDEARQELYSTVNSTGIEIRIPITAGIAGHVATTGEPVVIVDAYNDKRLLKTVDAKTGFRTRNMMCVPLKAKKGGVLGVVQLINKENSSMFTSAGTADSRDDGATSFDSDDLQFLQVFASQAATTIAHSVMTEETPVPVGFGMDGSAHAGESSFDMKMKDGTYVRRMDSFATGSMDGFDKETSTNCCSKLCATEQTEELIMKPVESEGCESVSTVASLTSSNDNLESDKVVCRVRRSGRARQRAAKWWASVRCRTPSLERMTAGMESRTTLPQVGLA